MGKSKHSAKRIEALRLLAATAAPHRRALGYGVVATLFVVAMRLALPWPLRGVVEHVFPSATGQGTLSTPLGVRADPVLVFCALYFLLAVATGTFEWIQRVWMARAASQTAHDLRAAAVAAVSRGARRTHAVQADVITRIIGDSARLKADLKGIFIHLVQNGLLLLAISGLFLYLAPRIGVLFLVSGLLAILIGYGTVEEVAETTRRQRKKESKYAAAIPDDAAGAESARRALDRSSTRKEVRITRIMGRSTLLVHAAVAATLGLAFWVGVSDVRAGTLAPGELFLFIAYAITIQRRTVMIGRQIARGGKVLANAQRIVALIDDARDPQAARTTLEREIRLEDVRLKRSPAHLKGARLGPLNLTIPSRQRLLVLGGDGAGKSSLLGVLAGRELVSRGRISWDGVEVSGVPPASLSVGYLPDEIAREDFDVGALLGPRPPSATEVATLKELGAWKVIRQLRENPDQHLESAELSPRERRAVTLGGILLGGAPVWILDEPVDGDSPRDRRRLEEVLKRAAEPTLIVGMRRPLLETRFDRVIYLKKGKIEFDGTPRAWQARKERIRAIRDAG